MNTWDDAFGQRGLAATTAAPMSVEQQQEQDLPPGAPPYTGGPLANPPRPTPSPNPNLSLTTLAAGGMNHAQLWMSGQSAQPVQQQQPFNSRSTIQDALRQNPRAPERVRPEDIGNFSWSSAFQ